jgi:arylsulfatase A-like enzyme
MYSTEGGIRVPLVLNYPAWHKEGGGDGVVDAFATVMDIAPTILELAGVPHPGTNIPFRGRNVEAMRGKSWAPFFAQPSAEPAAVQAIHGADDPAVGWELFGRAALRSGRWKIVHMSPSAHGTGAWQLYDLSADPGETDDLAGSEPERLREMVGLWDVYVRETGVVWGEALGLGTVDVEPRDIIGGDPLEDTRAWMPVSRGRAKTKA